MEVGGGVCQPCQPRSCRPFGSLLVLQQGIWATARRCRLPVLTILTGLISSDRRRPRQPDFPPAKATINNESDQQVCIESHLRHSTIVARPALPSLPFASEALRPTAAISSCACFGRRECDSTPYRDDQDALRYRHRRVASPFRPSSTPRAPLVRSVDSPTLPQIRLEVLRNRSAFPYGEHGICCARYYPSDLPPRRLNWRSGPERPCDKTSTPSPSDTSQLHITRTACPRSRGPAAKGSPRGQAGAHRLGPGSAR